LKGKISGSQLKRLNKAMIILEKKQQLSQSGKPEKMPSPKKEKKDISGFEGKPYIPQEKGREWIKSDEVFRTTGLPVEKRIKYWEEISKDTGYYLEPREAEKKLKELSMKRFEAKTDAEKKEIGEKIKLLKGFLGRK